MNIGFIGIRVNYKTTQSAPKRIANRLYDEIKKQNKNTYFFGLSWDEEALKPNELGEKEFTGALNKLREFIVKNNIEVVYLSRYYTKLALYLVILKKTYKFKLVYTLHGLIKKETSINGTFKGYGTFSEKLLLSNCEGIVAVSHQSKEEILKYYPSIRSDRITIINNGVEILEEFEPIDIREVLDIGNYKPIILSIGNRAIKNTGKLINSFVSNNKLYGNSVLVIIGDKTESYAKDLINKYKEYENIKFLDYVNPQYLNTLYKASSLYVQISLFETFGVSIIEALLHKKNAIVSYNLPIASYFNEREVVFYNDKKDNLDELMLKALEKSKDVNSEGFKRAQELFNWNNIAYRYFNFFENIYKEEK